MKETSPLLRLLRHAARHRPRVLAATACSALKKLFDIAPEILIGMAVNAVVAGGDAMGQLKLLGLVTIAIWVAESVFQYL